MNKFIRYWNQNRGKIILIIAIIAFIIIIIQITNNILRNSGSNNSSGSKIDKTQPTQSIITGEKVSVEKTEQNTNIIKEFVEYCNNEKYEKAYDLLTEEGKKEFNNDINTFIKNYCKNVFATKKTYNLDLWLNTNNIYTYKVTFYEDNLLATGSSNMNKNIEDYITIIHQNNEDKININGFIIEKTIHKSQEVNNVEIIINSKKVYKNYESYNITIRNYSNKTILVSDGQESDDICLVDKNDVKYPSFLHEIPSSYLLFKPGYERNLTIRFNKLYDLYRTVEKIQFNNIILDEEEYRQNLNDSNLEKIEVNIDI